MRFAYSHVSKEGDRGYLIQLAGRAREANTLLRRLPVRGKSVGSSFPPVGGFPDKRMPRYLTITISARTLHSQQSAMKTFVYLGNKSCPADHGVLPGSKLQPRYLHLGGGCAGQSAGVLQGRHPELSRKMHAISATSTGGGLRPLRIFALHEDRAAWQRAADLLERLSRQSTFGAGLACKSFRLDLFYMNSLREQAAIEAAESDVIILSANRKTRMSAVDRQWMIRWLGLKEDRPYLFCLVLGPQWDGGGEKNPLMTELDDFTSVAGVDYFCGPLEAPLAGAVAIFEDLDAGLKQPSGMHGEFLTKN